MSEKIKISELLDAKNFNKYKDQLVDYFERGGTWQELLGYDNDLMQSQYKKAYDLYQKGEFSEAAASFSYLTTLNPYEYQFWMGLGLSKQHQERYEEALVSYTAAASMDPAIPTPHFHMAQCYYALNVSDKTIEELQQTMEIAAQHKEYEEFAIKAHTLLTQLKIK